MYVVTLGSIDAPLYAISIIGFAIAVCIDDKLRKQKYTKEWNNGRRQQPSSKEESGSYFS